ncbi:MAG: sulfite exporter TauE/SafE family protein [Actinomycetota bacterium]|nr:sulfite exporter TauE/SafE family protein [Actinomycetota bacterium]
MPEVWTPLLIALVGAGVFFCGVSKTAMPVLGMLSSPLLVLALTPTIAAGFVVPMLIAGDFIALALYRQHANWPLIRKLVPGVLLGFVITAIMFIYLDTALLSRLVGLIILVSVVSEIWRQRAAVREREGAPSMTNPAAFVFFGTVTGITTLAANSGSAALSMYLVRMRVPMLVFMGTSTWFFFVLNVSKVPFVLALGLITPASLLANLWFAPALVLGAFAGAFIFRRMSQVVFVRIALALSVVASIWLVIHG